MWYEYPEHSLNNMLNDTPLLTKEIKLERDLKMK